MSNGAVKATTPFGKEVTLSNSLTPTKDRVTKLPPVLGGRKSSKDRYNRDEDELKEEQEWREFKAKLSGSKSCDILRKPKNNSRYSSKPVVNAKAPVGVNIKKNKENLKVKDILLPKTKVRDPQLPLRSINLKSRIKHENPILSK